MLSSAMFRKNKYKSGLIIKDMGEIGQSLCERIHENPHHDISWSIIFFV